MDESREILRAAFLEVVDNQIRDGNPAVTKETFERLKQEGHSATEARRLIAGVVAAEMFGIFKDKQSFNETRFAQRLQQLPDMPWSQDDDA